MPLLRCLLGALLVLIIAAGPFFLWSKRDHDAVLAFAKQANFEIAVSGWLGAKASEMETGPAMRLLPPGKVFCVYGAEEKEETGCLQAQAVGESLELPGGHHFDEDYDKLAGIIMKAVEQRLTPRPGQEATK